MTASEIEQKLDEILERSEPVEAARELDKLLADHEIPNEILRPILARYHGKLKKLSEELRKRGEKLREQGDGLGEFKRLIDGLSAMRSKSPRESTGIIESTFHELIEAAYPRRFEVPAGFCSPKRFSLCAFWSMFDCSKWTVEGLRNDAEEVCKNVHGAKVVSALIEKIVPTYFVSAAIIDALTKTDLPADFSLNEMPWPLDAMLFILPDGALSSPEGDVSFIALCKFTARTYPNDWMKWGKISDMVESFAVNHEGEEAAAVLAMTESGRILQWQHPLNSTSIFDATQTELIGGELSTLTAVSALSEIEQNFATKDLPKAAFQFVLAMLACPEMIEAGAIVRHASTKKGKAKRELWSPNFFGKSYRRYDAVIGSGDESQRHNRAHWRRGHFRHQRFGAGLSAIRVVWIQPVFVGKARLCA